MGPGPSHGGRSPAQVSGLSSGLDQGAAEAYADELLLHFGAEDDDLEDDDLDDLEDDLDDLFGEDEEDDDGEEGFGGLSSWPSRVRSADQQRFGAFRPLAGIGKTITSASSLATSAGHGLVASGYQVFGPPAPIVIDTSAPLPPSPQVVADKESLPPVYVSDPVLAEEAKKVPSVQSTAVMAPSTSFGASFQEGSVRPRKGREREAVVAGRLRSEKELRESEPSAPSPLVEDGGASPVMLEDGQLYEPCHGRLALVSCVSCNQMPRESYGTTGNGCLVCDDYGAILVPSSDLPHFAGTERFGFVAALLGAVVPLAAPVAQLAGGAVGQRKQAVAQETSSRAQKVYDRLRKQIEDKAQAAQAQEQASASVEKVSGIGGFLGGLDDLEDLDVEEDLIAEADTEEDEAEAFGLFGEDDDLDFLEDDDPLHEDLGDDDDRSSHGRIVRILFPRGRI